MPKTVTSPIKRFSGSVTLADPMTLPQAEAISEVHRYFFDNRKQKGEYISLLDLDKPRITALLVCVEKWELQGISNGVTLETFPMSPDKTRHKLVDWLWLEVNKIFDEEDTVPNE